MTEICLVLVKKFALLLEEALPFVHLAVKLLEVSVNAVIPQLELVHHLINLRRGERRGSWRGAVGPRHHQPPHATACLGRT